MSFGSTTLFSRFDNHAFAEMFHVETQDYHHEMLVKAWSLLIIYKTHVNHNNLVSSLIVETESRCFQMDNRLLMLPPPLSLCTRVGALLGCGGGR